MRRTIFESLTTLVVVGLLMTAAAVVARARELKYPAPPVNDQSLYLTSGKALRSMTVGYTALTADLYWIRTIQYYGDVKLNLGRQAKGVDASRSVQTDYQLLYPLLDLTTTLDPRFNIAYRFGAIFLAETYPGGPGRPDLAITLLQKGLRERPDKWEYMQDIGFVHYWWTHDYKAAADWFQRASEVPGAPWWLRSLAATTVAEGGDRRSSRTMWAAIRDSAELDWLRADAERRLQQLDALDQIDELQKRVDRITQRDGRPAADWQPLIRAGLLPGIPLDPTRATPYEIDASGRVRLSTRSTLFPLPEEPKPLITPVS